MKASINLLMILLLFTASAVKVCSQDLFKQIEQNNTGQVKSLIQADPKLIAITDESKSTPLHYAVRLKQTDIAEFLISMGADVNARDINLRTPLHQSVIAGNIDCSKILIRNGSDIKALDFRNQMPLHYSSQAGNIDLTELLIKSGSPTDVKNNYGRTPLLLCCRERGNAKVAEILIGAGSDVNAKDTYESTPLELAAWRGYKEIVGLLISKGAEIPVEGRRAYVILTSACQKGLSDLVIKQVEKGIKISPSVSWQASIMHDAARGGSPEIIQLLTDKGLKADLKDNIGWTPLHYATLNDHYEAIEMLLKNGADINSRTKMGQTAYNVADEYGKLKSKELLAKKGCNTDPIQFPVLEGPYIGMTLPDTIPLIFASGIISSIWGLHSSLAFSPDGNEVYWSPMIEIPGKTYPEGGLWYMKRINNKWTQPGIASFSVREGWNDGEAFFSPDGNRIYFNSTRPNPSQKGQSKENIWFVDKKNGGWSEPAPVDQVINQMSMHWQFSVDKKGNIYFASDNAGGSGMQDIYCSRLVGGKYQKPENLGKAINSDKGEMTPFISPEGDYLIFCRELELFISFKKDNEWSIAKSMGAPVNTGFELCPLVTPDGRFLIFLSGREGESYPFWVSSKVIENLRLNESGK